VVPLRRLVTVVLVEAEVPSANTVPPPINVAEVEYSTT
jgi:hypothetical protein